MKSRSLSALGKQARHHSVALISLVLAVISLSYNTWRNEATEENRNLRHAAFEILLKLGELQQVTFLSHYDTDHQRGNPRTGWAYTLTVQDLSRVLPFGVQQSAESLLQTWGQHWPGLGSSQASVDSIVAAIDDTRAETLRLLAALD